MNITKQFVSIGALCAVSTFAFAEYIEESVGANGEKQYVKYVYTGPGEPKETKENEQYDPFFELIIMGGIASLNADDSVVIFSKSETNKFVQTNEDEWQASTGRLGLGYNVPLKDEIQEEELTWFPIMTPQFNYYYLNGDINGDVYRFEDSTQVTENYIMDFTSNRVMLDLSLTVAAYEHFSVYALAGAGVSWNDLDFSSGSINEGCTECQIDPLEIDSDTSSGFVYELGVGVNYAALEYLTVSLEYLYTVFTDVQTGNSAEDYSEVFGGTDMDIDAQALLLGIRVGL